MMKEKIYHVVKFAIPTLLLICVCGWLMMSSSGGDPSIHRSLQRFSNKATFLYIVGVEGVGHHGVSPALATIGRTCQHFVYYENEFLRSRQRHMVEGSYRNSLVRVKETRVPTTSKNSEIVILEDGSFPTDTLFRHSTNETKKTTGMYNLEWVYDNVKEAGMDIKFLYLNRDFYRTVVSHPELDGGDYKNHSQVLYDFVWFINEEYQRIEAKESGLWRQISYEWFSPLEDCTALVTSLIDFIGWTECDVALACRLLEQELRPPKIRAVDETIFAYTQQFNVTLPIPVLNVTLTAHAAHNTAPIEHAHLTPHSVDTPITLANNLRFRAAASADGASTARRATRVHRTP